MIKLGLGTVQFGMHYGIANKSGKTGAGEVKRILAAALQSGIDLLDTASGYGDAEKVLGEAGVGGHKIVSKFLPAACTDELAKQLATSLRHLKVDKLYGYLSHRPLDLLANRWQWDFLQHQKATGVVDKIGYSLNEPFELQELLQNGCVPDLVQVPFNFLDRRFEEDIKNLKRRGVEIHTRSAFLQGLFFTDPALLPSFFDEVKPIINDFKSKYPDVGGALLSYVLQKDFIDKVIIGVESTQQLNENIKAIQSEAKVELELPEVNEKILIPANWPKQ